MKCWEQYSNFYIASASDRLTMIFACPVAISTTPTNQGLAGELGQPDGERAADDKTRRLFRDLEMMPVVQPKVDRKAKWDCGLDLYKLRNGAVRLFRKVKGYRRIYIRFDKLDAMFPGFLNFALIVELIII